MGYCLHCLVLSCLLLGPRLCHINFGIFKLMKCDRLRNGYRQFGLCVCVALLFLRSLCSGLTQAICRFCLFVFFGIEILRKLLLPAICFYSFFVFPSSSCRSLRTTRTLSSCHSAPKNETEHMWRAKISLEPEQKTYFFVFVQVLSVGRP